MDVIVDCFAAPATAAGCADAGPIEISGKLKGIAARGAKAAGSLRRMTWRGENSNNLPIPGTRCERHLPIGFGKTGQHSRLRPTHSRVTARRFLLIPSYVGRFQTATSFAPAASRANCRADVAAMPVPSFRVRSLPLAPRNDRKGCTASVRAAVVVAREGAGTVFRHGRTCNHVFPCGISRRRGFPRRAGHDGWGAVQCTWPLITRPFRHPISARARADRRCGYYVFAMPKCAASPRR